MRMKFLIALAAIVATILPTTALSDNVTTLGRLQVDWPDLLHAGGAALETHIHDGVQKLSDHQNARYQEYTSIADNTVVELDHNFGVNLVELRVLVYTGSGTNLTKVSDPEGLGTPWTIAEKTGSEKTVIEVTTPNGGGPHTFAIVVLHSPREYVSLDVLNDAQIDGVAKIADGAIGSPSIAFTDDTNTGIYSPANDEIAFQTNGTEKMRIESSGEVGIGGSPTTILDIQDPSTTTHALNVSTAFNRIARFKSTDSISFITLEDDTTTADNVRVQAIGNDMFLYAGGSDRLKIEDTGEVGIGTGITPGSKLDVDGDIRGDSISFDDGTNVLDDHTVATAFTPTIKFGGTAIPAVTNFNSYYMRIGDHVFFQIGIRFEEDGGVTGDMSIELTGLPTPRTSSTNQGMSVTQFRDVVFPTGKPLIETQIFSSSGTPAYNFRFYGDGNQTVLDDTHINNGAASTNDRRFGAIGHYRVN